MNKEPILEARLQRQWAARAGAGVTSANIRSLHTVSTSGPCLAFIPFFIPMYCTTLVLIWPRNRRSWPFSHIPL